VVTRDPRHGDVGERRDGERDALGRARRREAERRRADGEDPEPPRTIATAEGSSSQRK
jgi:hypothetical protein